jgi:hypothetical protein
MAHALLPLSLPLSRGNPLPLFATIHLHPTGANPATRTGDRALPLLFPDMPNHIPAHARAKLFQLADFELSPGPFREFLAPACPDFDFERWATTVSPLQTHSPRGVGIALLPARGEKVAEGQMRGEQNKRKRAKTYTSPSPSPPRLSCAHHALLAAGNPPWLTAFSRFIASNERTAERSGRSAIRPAGHLHGEGRGD